MARLTDFHRQQLCGTRVDPLAGAMHRTPTRRTACRHAPLAARRRAHRHRPWAHTVTHCFDDLCGPLPHDALTYKTYASPPLARVSAPSCAIVAATTCFPSTRSRSHPTTQAPPLGSLEASHVACFHSPTKSSPEPPLPPPPPGSAIPTRWSIPTLKFATNRP
jgi:hypothetical protein